MNTAHGCGYRRPDGSIGPSYPIFATRSLLKRIYTIVRKHDPRGQVNVHQSSCMVTPTLAFATSYWDGEHVQGLPRPKEPGAILPMDAFRCEFMGHNWGVPAELLHYDSGPLKRSEAMALGLLHDVPVRPFTMQDLDQLTRIWQAFDAFGRHEAVWIPVLGQCPVCRQPAGQREGEPLQPAGQRLRGCDRQHGEREMSGGRGARSGSLEAADEAGGP